MHIRGLLETGYHAQQDAIFTHALTNTRTGTRHDSKRAGDGLISICLDGDSHTDNHIRGAALFGGNVSTSTALIQI